MRKRILLFHISKYSGHHRASLAIEGALKKMDKQVEILNIDFLRYFHPLLGRATNKIYLEVIKKMPQKWEYAYNNQKVYKRLQKSRKLLSFFKSARLKRLLKNFKPEIIVCTQAYPAWMMAEYKDKKDLHIPVVGVLTDYAPHLYWLHPKIDFYVVASLEAEKALVKMGVEKTRISNFGIPIDIKFFDKIDKRKIIKKIGLIESSPIILVMGGRNGLGPIKKLVKSFEKFSYYSPQVIIVCGKNKELKKELREKSNFLHYPLKIFGYVENINELMKISSLIITKAGGLTVSESLVCGLPMIIINPIPGQEVNNAEFLLKKDLALMAQDEEEAVKLTFNLLSDRDKLQEMIFNIKNFSKSNATVRIASLIFDIVNKNS